MGGDAQAVAGSGSQVGTPACVHLGKNQMWMWEGGRAREAPGRLGQQVGAGDAGTGPSGEKKSGWKSRFRRITQGGGTGTLNPNNLCSLSTTTHLLLSPSGAIYTQRKFFFLLLQDAKGKQ